MGVVHSQGQLGAAAKGTDTIVVAADRLEIVELVAGIQLRLASLVAAASLAAE
jgi:hypothetical protein